MKKLLFLCSFLLVAGMASAQSCSKTCAKKCTKAKTAAVETTGEEAPAAEARVASALAEADTAAEANENIQRRVCGTSGKVSYFEKSTCSTSGKISYDEVQYCTKSKGFSSVASASVEADVVPVHTDAMPADAKSKKACCAKGDKKACSSKKKAQ